MAGGGGSSCLPRTWISPERDADDDDGDNDDVCLGGADDATRRLPFTIARQVVMGREEGNPWV